MCQRTVRKDSLIPGWKARFDLAARLRARRRRYGPQGNRPRRRRWRRAAAAFPAKAASPLGVVTGVEGNLTGLQRTWLARDGSGSSPLPIRGGHGRLLGNAVRFGTPRNIMASAPLYGLLRLRAPGSRRRPSRPRARSISSSFGLPSPAARCSSSVFQAGADRHRENTEGDQSNDLSAVREDAP